MSIKCLIVFGIQTHKWFDPAEIYSPPFGAGHGRLTSNVEIEQAPPPFPSGTDSSSTTFDNPNPNPSSESNRLKIGVDAALPPKAHLTIGYGNGGSKPWQFIVPDGQSKDVGFLRLFLSTRPGNFQNIIQESPFDGSRSSEAISQRREMEDVERWMVKTATIVQVPI